MAFLKDLIVQGTSRFIGDAQGSKFIVDGATSSQFLKGDGTLDSNTYLTQNDKVILDKGGTGNNSNTSVIDGGIVNEDLTITDSGHESAININPGGIDIISNWTGSSNSSNNSGTNNVNIYTGAGKLYYNSNEVITTATLPINHIIDYSSQYLTFVALENGTFTLTIGSGIDTTLLTSVSYSTDDGETWTTTNNQDSTEIVITTPTITKGNKVLWKGIGTAMSAITTATASADRPTYASIFSSSGNFNAEGNIMSLLYGDNFNNVTSFSENSSSNFAALFYSYNISTTAKIVNTNNLILPATTLTAYCYCYVFQGCTTLKTPPELPAMTMTEGCYRNMFYNCTDLLISPELPATTLAEQCYMSLFYNCKSLKEAPQLPAVTLESECYYYMFVGCTSLEIAPKLLATTLAYRCYGQMFKDCTSLITPPELPATTLASYCYSSMFYGCTSLTTVPELPATTLIDNCYNGMFSYCSSLTVLPNKLLQATTLTTNCYRCMFQCCSSLTTTPELPATTLATYCYAGMFQECPSLIVAPKILPATTLVSNCYDTMFLNCKSLITAPELPATTLVSNCYRQLFNGCTSLNYIKAIFTTTPSTTYTNNWVKNVAANGTFVKSQDAQWSVTGDHGIPTNWNTYINNEYEVVRQYNLADVATSGSYNDLTDTPTIPAAQVNSDWNAVSGVAQILNKPTIPTTYAASATAAGPADKAVSIPFAEVDSTSTDSAFTATVSGITELRDGVCVYLRNGVEDSVSGCTLNINSLGAKPIYSSATGNPITSAFTIAYTYLFVYNSTRVEGGCWDLYAGYENPNASNTSAYIVRTNSLRMPTTDKFYRYRILFTSLDGTHYIPATTSTSTNATSARTVNQRVIDPFGRIVYYNSTTAVNAEAMPAATTLRDQSTVTLGYSFNRSGAALTLTTWKPVYLKCAPQTTGGAIIDADTPYVQDLPVTEDGKIYIFLGVAYSATAVEILVNHPIYYYKDGAIRRWTGAEQRIAALEQRIAALETILNNNS